MARAAVINKFVEDREYLNEKTGQRIQDGLEKGKYPDGHDGIAIESKAGFEFARAKLGLDADPDF